MKIINKTIFAMCAMVIIGVCCNTNIPGDKEKTKTIDMANYIVPSSRLEGETNIKFVYYEGYKEFEITSERDKKRIKNIALNIIRAIVGQDRQYFFKQAFSGKVTFTYTPSNGAQSRNDNEKIAYVEQMLLDIFERGIIREGMSLYEALKKKKRITIEMRENGRSVLADSEFVMLYINIKIDDDNIGYSFGFFSLNEGGVSHMVLSNFSININDSMWFKNDRPRK